MVRLWEVDHAYYCNEGNYFAPGNDQSCEEFATWAAFVDENGDAQMDLNLLFRWDWSEEDTPFHGDEYYRNGVLKIFYMGQRKGLYRWNTVQVCRADEPAVRAWLQTRWEYLKDLWAPLS